MYAVKSNYNNLLVLVFITPDIGVSGFKMILFIVIAIKILAI